MFSYAKRSTLSQPKVTALEYVQGNAVGHVRSLPQGVSTPVPSVRSTPSRAYELPVPVEASATPEQPVAGPVNAPTLEPVSRL